MKTKGKVIISILLIIGLVLGGGAWWFKKNLSSDEPFVTQIDPDTGKTIKAFNVLLLGSDARPNDKKGRTDAIIVVQVSNERIAMLSIPRDTRVDIPGYGKQKVNAAAYFENPEVTAKIVSEIIGQPVQKYILVRWEGFMNVVDALGGVDMNIPKDITSYSMDGGEEYRVDLKKGTQHLDGKASLAFARYRNAPLGDIYRVNNQLEFMKALADKCKQPGSLLALPTVLPELYRNVDTNIDFIELLILARAGINFQESTVLTQALPGYFFNLNGICYWGFDPAQAQQVTYDLFFNGTTTAQVVMETPSAAVSTTKKQPQVAQQTKEKDPEIIPKNDVTAGTGDGGVTDGTNNDGKTDGTGNDDKTGGSGNDGKTDGAGNNDKTDGSGKGT